jgi:predicted nuclease with TOPRIM domain
VNDLLQKNDEQTNQLYEVQVELSRLQENSEEIQDENTHLHNKVEKLKAEIEMKVRNFC